MCNTCGCEKGNEITIRKPGEENHSHHHSHENHEHSHHHGENHEHTHHHEYSHKTKKEIQIETDVLQKNNLLANRNKGYFEAKKILALNLVSSPGSGKTSLLEKTIKEYGKSFPIYVIEGDQQTMNDAERIKAAGASAIQINTGNGCHLDSDMVNKAIKQLDVKEKSVLFIENVGNLVCPSMFDLGESYRVVIISVSEGDDKPLKYAPIFASSHLCIINKTDLLPYVDFSVKKVKENALKINHHLEFIELSAKSNEGMIQWYQWLEDRIKSFGNTI